MDRRSPASLLARWLACVVIAGAVAVLPAPSPGALLVDASTAPRILYPQPGSTTLDATPTVVGTARPGDVITLVDADGDRLCVPDPVVRADGTWRCRVRHALSDGANRMVPIATTPAGPVFAGAVARLQVDGTLPPVPVLLTPAEGAVVPLSRPVIAGRGQPGFLVLVFDTVSGSGIGDPTVGPLGTWSFVPSRPLPDGPHTLVALQRDPMLEDDLSDVSDARNLVVDTTASAAPAITAPASGTRAIGSRPPVAGSGEAGATVAVLDETGRTVCAPVVTAAGRWSCTPPAPFAAGVHALRATQTDRAGNVSPAGPLVPFTVGTAAVSAPRITTPDSGAQTNSTRPTVAGIATPRTTVLVYDERGRPVCRPAAVVSPTGLWSCPSAVAFVAGRHTLTPRSAGRMPLIGPPNGFTLDLTPPPAPVITSPVAGDDFVSRTLTISGTGEPRAAVTLHDEAAGTVCTPSPVVTAAGRWSCTPSTPLLVESHTLVPTQSDAAGNESPAGRPVSFTVGIGAPAIAASSTGSRTNDTSPTITGTGEPGNTVHVLDPEGRSVCVSDPVVDADGGWSCVSRELADGAHRLIATQTDPDGHESPVSAPLVLTIDTHEPAAPVLIRPAGGAVLRHRTPTITGTGEPGAVVVVIDGAGALLGTSTVAGDGTWSLQPLHPLQDGGHTLTATQTDVAGNLSAGSATVTVTVAARPTGPAPVPATTPAVPPTAAGPGRPGSADVEVPTADTGTDSARGLLGGGVLVVAGVALVLLTRRRRR